MKHILVISTLILCFFVGSAQAESKKTALHESNLKLKELASLPEGLSVSNYPDPVLHRFHSPSLSGVQWIHSTTVSSQVGPVTIVEFGYFVDRNGHWEYSHGTGVPYIYTSSDFAEKYHCPGSILMPGESYTDALNQSIIDCVPEQMVMWYFIGLDASGNRVKGEVSVKLLAKSAE